MKRNRIVRQSLRWSGLLVAALTALSLLVRAQDVPPVDDPPIDENTTLQIQCSPAVVNLNSRAGGDWMTVHTDLPWSETIAKDDVTLNGLTAALIKPDDCGDLVAKFRLSDLKPKLTAPSTDLVLTVEIDGVVYEGLDTVRVIQPPGLARGKNTQQNNTPAGQPQRVRQCEK